MLLIVMLNASHTKFLTGSLMGAWSARAVAFEGHVLEGETHNMVFGPSYTRATRYFLPISEASRPGVALRFESSAEK